MIKAPAMFPNAKPDLRGWVEGGTVVFVQKHTQAQIDEWKADRSPRPAPKPEPIPEPVEIIVEEPEAPTVKSLEDMTKAELEMKGREVGIELDRRKSKATLIAELKEYM